MPNNKWENMKSVAMGAIKKALGGTYGTSRSIMRAEAGMPTLEAITCVSVVRAWGQMKQFDEGSQLRAVWERQVKDAVGGRAPTAGSMAARTVWAMEEVFGTEQATEMIVAEMTKTEYKRRAKRAAKAYFQRDMEDSLKQHGREHHLLIKPKFGIAK